jgi:hypothetical protein
MEKRRLKFMGLALTKQDLKYVAYNFEGYTWRFDVRPFEDYEYIKRGDIQPPKEELMAHCEKCIAAGKNNDDFGKHCCVANEKISRPTYERIGLNYDEHISTRSTNVAKSGLRQANSTSEETK